MASVAGSEPVVQGLDRWTVEVVCDGLDALPELVSEWVDALVDKVTEWRGVVFDASSIEADPMAAQRTGL